MPAVSLARLAEIGVGDAEGYVPRVAEGEGLTVLQEEALMDMIYQSFVVEVLSTITELVSLAC